MHACIYMRNKPYNKNGNGQWEPVTITDIQTDNSHAPSFPQPSNPLLPLLHQQEMHTPISQHDEHRAENSQAHRIHLQRSIIEAERAQDRSSGNFDIETVFMVDEAERSYFVDDETLEAVVENGELTIGG
jgi:hypothetical protein